jgi:hypothetical protein
MPEMWKTFRLRDGAGKRSDILAATASRREVGRSLHGMLPAEKVINGSNWLIKRDRRKLYLVAYCSASKTL